MTEPDPTYTATIPADFSVKPVRPKLPEWFRLYLIQRRRALKTEMVSIEELLGIRDN